MKPVSAHVPSQSSGAAATKHPTSHHRLRQRPNLATKRKVASVVGMSAFDCVDAVTLPAVSRPHAGESHGLRLEIARLAIRTFDDT